MELNKLNKNLLKVAAIIAVFYGILYCFTIIGAFIGVPILMGAFYINSITVLSKENIKALRGNLLKWAAVYLITLNMFSAILLVIVYFLVGKNDITKATVVEDPEPEITEEEKDEIIDDKVKKLETLKEQGLLTDEEFEKLIDEL